MKQPKKYCEHCGAPMVEHKQSLSKVLARAFYRARQHADSRLVFDIAECNLTYSQRENLRKLQYWNLIAKYGDNPKGGIWQILPDGVRFLAGELKVHKIAWTYRGVVRRYEGKMIDIQTVTGGWRYRQDYARDAQPSGPLL